MKRTILLFIIFACSRQLTAQEKEKEEIHRFAPGISMGTVPVPGNPNSIQPSLEIFITKRISVLNEVGLQLEKDSDYDSTARNKRYFKYKAEARFYLGPLDVRGTPYVGLQFTTARRSFDIDRAGRFYEKGVEDSMYTYTKASVNSPVKTLSVQLGANIRCYDRFYIDVSGGVGYRFINTSYPRTENLAKVPQYEFLNIKPLSSYKYLGHITRTQLNFNVRLSYRL